MSDLQIGRVEFSDPLERAYRQDEDLAHRLNVSQQAQIRRASELTRLEQAVVDAAVAARLCADEVAGRTLSWYASEACTESYADARNREARLHAAFEDALDRLIEARGKDAGESPNTAASADVVLLAVSEERKACAPHG